MFNDLLLLHQDKDKPREFSATAFALLQSLGFMIKYPKQAQRKQNSIGPAEYMTAYVSTQQLEQVLRKIFQI